MSQSSGTPSSGTPSSGTPEKNAYRTSAGYEMDDRVLLLRGGKYDGRVWVGTVAVGRRVFCGGDDPWSTDGMYIVSEQTATTDDGRTANIAVPAFASGN